MRGSGRSTENVSRPSRYFDGGVVTKGHLDWPNRTAALDRAEQLRPIFRELANVSARKIAAALNARKIAPPAGGEWHAATVIRVQKRLAEGRSGLMRRDQYSRRHHHRGQLPRFRQTSSYPHLAKHLCVHALIAPTA
jgi:Recombinase